MSFPLESARWKQKFATFSQSHKVSSDAQNMSHLFSTFSSKASNVVKKGTSQNTKPTEWLHRYTPELEEQEIQDVMRQLIFQAGVDYETRPLIVLLASAFPDPKVVSYDRLLSRILLYLDPFVESDYTVVLFTAGSRFQPSWIWIWKAYRSLNRKYRKNLKKLIVVHSSWFSRMLFTLAGTIISPKFFRKIVYMSTLSQLAHNVPITQIAIPPAVYQENLKCESEIILPGSQKSSLFGVPLEDLMGANEDDNALPRVITDAISFLRIRGLRSEGLFRRSPNSTLLKQAADAYERGHPVSLESYHDPHIAAVLIKKFLRDLPNPLFPEDTYPLVRNCPKLTPGVDQEPSIRYIRDVLLPLLHPRCLATLLSAVLRLMHEVSLEAQHNLMDAQNLALVLAPNLLASGNPIADVEMCVMPKPRGRDMPFVATRAGQQSEGSTLASVMEICIKEYFAIFANQPAS